jgi:hypothetical protein
MTGRPAARSASSPSPRPGGGPTAVRAVARPRSADGTRTRARPSSSPPPVPAASMRSTNAPAAAHARPGISAATTAAVSAAGSAPEAHALTARSRLRSATYWTALDNLNASDVCTGPWLTTSRWALPPGPMPRATSTGSPTATGSGCTWPRSPIMTRRPGQARLTCLSRTPTPCTRSGAGRESAGSPAG